MVKEKSMFPGSSTLTVDQELVQFCAGNIGMAVAGCGSAGKLGKGDLATNFEIKVADLPSFDANPVGKYSLDVTRGPGISAQSKNKKEAFKVLQWFESEEVAGALTAGGSDFYLSIKSVVGNPKYKVTNPIVNAFIPSSDYALYPVYPSGLVLEGDDYYKVFTSLILGAPDMDKSLNDLNDRYNKALQKAFTDGTLKKEDYIFPDFDASKLK